MADAHAAAAGEARFAAGLAMIAGYVDAYGFATLRTYVSFMSGNTTQSGYMAGQGDLSAAMASLLAIVSFVLGVFAGTWIEQADARRPWLAPGMVAAVLAASLAPMAVGSAAGTVAISTLSLAMGIMNTVLSHVGGQRVSVTFVTGTLAAMATHAALAMRRVPLLDAQGAWDTHQRRALFLLRIWTGFVLGALLGTVATLRFGVAVLMLPVVALVAVAILRRTGRDVALTPSAPQIGEQ